MATAKLSSWALTLVNGLTLSRLATGTLSAIAFYSESFKRYLLFLFCYMLLSDLLDGALARRLGVSTHIGGIFDYAVDRFNFYLIIGILIHERISPLLFLPFFLRDLLYISVQAYITIPSVRGTKAVSFVSTAAAYLYVLILNYGHRGNVILDSILFFAFILSLVNMTVRISRLRHRLLAKLKEDLCP